MGCSLGQPAASTPQPKRQDDYKVGSHQLVAGESAADGVCGEEAADEPTQKEAAASPSALTAAMENGDRLYSTQSFHRRVSSPSEVTCRLRTLLHCRQGGEKSAPVAAVAFVADGMFVAHVLACHDLVPRMEGVEPCEGGPCFDAADLTPGRTCINDLCATAPESRVVLTCSSDPYVCLWATGRSDRDWILRMRLPVTHLTYGNGQPPPPTHKLPGLRVVRGSPDGLLVAAAALDAAPEEDMLLDVEDDIDAEPQPVQTHAVCIMVWSLPTAHQIAIFSEHYADVLCLAFAPSSDMVASGDRDGIVLIWAPPRGYGKCNLLQRMQLQSAVLSCAFSSCGDWLATCDAGALYLFEVQTGRSVFVVRAEESRVPGFRTVGWVGPHHIIAAAAGVPRVIVVHAVSATTLCRITVPAPVCCSSTWGRIGAVAVGDVDGGVHVLQFLDLVTF